MVDKLQEVVGEKGIAAFVGALLMLVPLLIPYALVWRTWGQAEQRILEIERSRDDMRSEMRERAAALSLQIQANRDTLFSQSGIVPLLREINVVLTDVKENSEETKQAIKELERRVGRVEMFLPMLKPDDVRNK